MRTSAQRRRQPGSARRRRLLATPAGAALGLRRDFVRMRQQPISAGFSPAGRPPRRGEFVVDRRAPVVRVLAQVGLPGRVDEPCSIGPVRQHAGDQAISRSILLSRWASSRATGGASAARARCVAPLRHTARRISDTPRSGRGPAQRAARVSFAHQASMVWIAAATGAPPAPTATPGVRGQIRASVQVRRWCAASGGGDAAPARP